MTVVWQWHTCATEVWALSRSCDASERLISHSLIQHLFSSCDEINARDALKDQHATGIRKTKLTKCIKLSFLILRSIQPKFCQAQKFSWWHGKLLFSPRCMCRKKGKVHIYIFSWNIVVSFTFFPASVVSYELYLMLEHEMACRNRMHLQTYHPCSTKSCPSGFLGKVWTPETSRKLVW